MKTFIMQLASKKSVSSVSDERQTDDGVWIYLNYGFCWEMEGQHIIHEDTIRELKLSFSSVRICNFPECKQNKPKEIDNTKFKKGSGVYTCMDCGKKTRDTGEGGAQVELCKKCYENGEEYNRLSDEGE